MKLWLGLALLLCVALAGCAQAGQSSNDDSHNRFGGFYGGVSGGGMNGP